MADVNLLPWAIGGSLAGAAISAGGSILSGNSQRRAGRQARDADILRGMRQRLNLTQSLYGAPDMAGTLAQTDPGYWERLLRDTYGIGDREAGFDIDAANLPQVLAMLNARGLGGGLPEPGQEGGLIGERRARASKAAARGRQIMADFDIDTGRLDNLAAGEEWMAEQFGRGADEVIDAEARRALESANATATAELAARGLGNSTLLANQLAQNSILSGERVAAGKVGVRQAVTDRKMSARRNRTSLAATRATQRNALANLILDRDLSWEDLPTQTRLAIETGPLMNPGAGVSTLPYYSGASGVGEALQGVGNTAAGLGSLALMASLYPDLFGGD